MPSSDPSTHQNVQMTFAEISVGVDVFFHPSAQGRRFFVAPTLGLKEEDAKRLVPSP
jgi:hypothetical protein